MKWRFATTQPNLRVLSANQESRTVALSFYKQSFGQVYRRSFNQDLALSDFRPGFWRRYCTLGHSGQDLQPIIQPVVTNPSVDRICPMGLTDYLDEHNASKLLKGYSSCAINVHEYSQLASTAPGINILIAPHRLTAATFTDIGQNESMSEILLYNCYESPTESGTFNFVDVPKETYSGLDWETLWDFTARFERGSKEKTENAYHKGTLSIRTVNLIRN